MGVVFLSIDGSQLAAGCEDGSVQLWNMSNRSPTVTFK